MNFAEILDDIASGQLKKLSSKVPEWEGVDVEIPNSLNVEQCSSSSAAHYKSELASRYGSRIADLTGGLGVDSWFFSRCFKEVLYNERDTALFEAVRRNFGKLGCANVVFSNRDAQSSDTLSALAAFNPDVVFIDPARRSALGKKVFLLEDCSPDVTSLLPSLFGICPKVILKLSPMADISMLAARLGGHLSEIHIVEIGSECKELVCVLDSEIQNDFDIVVTDLRSALRFRQSEERAAGAQYAGISEGDVLFEPGPALMKSGAYKLICGKLNLSMLSADSHLYVAHSPSVPLGKCRRVVETIAFGNAGLKFAGKKYPCAEVSAKGIRMRSDELRSKLGVRSGGEVHIYGTILSSGEKLLLVTK